MCTCIDAAFLLVFSLNICYATYFIRFPRKSPARPAPAPSPIPPPPASAPGSPAASILRSSTGAAPRSGSKLGLSPNVCCLSNVSLRTVSRTDGYGQTTPQRQLPFSSSISSSIAASDPYNLAKSYSLGFSDPNLSFATSTPSPTPSPLAAYKGRRGVGVAREFYFILVFPSLCVEAGGEEASDVGADACLKSGHSHRTVGWVVACETHEGVGRY